MPNQIQPISQIPPQHIQGWHQMKGKLPWLLLKPDASGLTSFFHRTGAFTRARQLFSQFDGSLAQVLKKINRETNRTEKMELLFLAINVIDTYRHIIQHKFNPFSTHTDGRKEIISNVVTRNLSLIEEDCTGVLLSLGYTLPTRENCMRNPHWNFQS